MAVNTLMKKIYRGSLKPGDKLPTERRMTEELDVDRGALRIGLRQLESMGIIRIRHGDGIYVRDYMENAGIDFLKTLFMVHEAEGEAPVIDDYLVNEIWEFWIMLFPAVVEMAASKISNRDMRELTALLDEEAGDPGDRERIIELELRSHELIVGMADNTILTLLFNSCLPLRRRIVSMQIMGMTGRELIEHIQSKRALVAEFLSSDSGEIEGIIRTFKARMQGYADAFRKNSFRSAASNKKAGT